jgi:hypothetical protein
MIPKMTVFEFKIQSMPYGQAVYKKRILNSPERGIGY